MARLEALALGTCFACIDALQLEAKGFTLKKINLIMCVCLFVGVCERKCVSV